MVLEPGFIESIENHPSLLYTDTDSIYTGYKSEFDKTDINQWKLIIDEAVNLANEINDEINNYCLTELVEFAGIDPQYQRLYFKTEMVALRMLQFLIKKTYALSYIYDEGKILNKPKPKTTGGHIKKSSTPQISKDLLTDIYDTLLFGEASTINDMRNLIFTDLFLKYKNLFEKALNEMDIDYIGTPTKYGFTKSVTKWVWGARFYNMFFKDELRPGSSMYSISVTYNLQKMQNLIKSREDDNEYHLKASDVESKFDQLSIPVGTKIDKNVYEYLQKETDFALSYDKNFNFTVVLKFGTFKGLFS